MERNLKKIKYWICDLVILLWFLSMVGVTWLTRNLYNQVLQDAQWENAYGNRYRLEDFYEGINVSGLPGHREDLMFDAMVSVCMLRQGFDLYEDANLAYRLLNVKPEIGVAFYDPEGERLLTSGKYLRFQYYTEESWKSGEFGIDGWGWVSLQGDADDTGAELATKFMNEMEFEKLFSDNGLVDLIRMRGKWKGTEFVPEVYDYIVDAGDGDWQKRDAQGGLKWSGVSEALEGAETIYLVQPRLVDCGSALTDELVNLIEDNLAETGEMGTVDHIAGSIRHLNKYSLDNITVFDCVAFPGAEGWGGWSEDTELYMFTMSRSHPLQAAIRSLVPVYIVSFLAVGAALWILIRMMNSRVLDVVVNQLQSEKTEITRLNKALDYAHRAEENRRALVSGVAHELKTPLAVIHGYAEGLKERIAEDKRDKYLDTILAETERMDGLVLQMLDLSRLEAGKVKLARDTFDLGEMVREVFGKLELLAAQKNLELSFEMPEKLVVTADRGRIEQVVTNFASNAVRYTPPGGWIRVRIFSREDGWGMTVENKSSPFSPEQLERVFDSFYRIDESRTGKGTGLGLAIARSIVELHGGNCHVRNTGPGVEFGFSVSVK